MTWRKCINPIGVKVEHYHDFKIGNKDQTFQYANSICPACFYRLLNLKHPITVGYGKPEIFKQAGPDTL